MDHIDYLAIISNVGFPIFVALYFMFRLEKIIKTNTKAIEKVIEIANYNMRTINSMAINNGKGGYNGRRK